MDAEALVAKPKNATHATNTPKSDARHNTPKARQLAGNNEWRPNTQTVRQSLTPIPKP